VCCHICLVDSFWYAGAIDVHVQKHLQVRKKSTATTDTITDTDDIKQGVVMAYDVVVSSVPQCNCELLCST